MKGERWFFWAYLLGGLAGGLAYWLSSSILFKAVVICSLSAASVLAIIAGLFLHRPGRRLPWLLVAGMQLLWTAGWILWEARIVSTGSPPAPNSLVNVVFLSGYPLLAAALLFLLWQRERNGAAILDVGILCAAVFAVAWAVLLNRYVDDKALPIGGRVVQIAYGVCDIALAAIVLRLLAGVGSRSRSFFLLLSGTVLLVASEFVWNWSTRLGSYSPGAWADLGWVLSGTGLGLAALSSSTATLYDRVGATVRNVRLWRLLPVLLASAVGPTLILLEVLEGDATIDETAPIAGITVVVTVLVAARLGLNLREQGRLNDELVRRGRRVAELAYIMESTADAVIAATRNRQITAWNAGATRLFGYTADEALGRSIGIIAPAELELGQIRMRDDLLSGKNVTGYETQRMHKDGHLLDVSITLSALRNDEGDVVAYSSIIRDVSERKELEAERERAQQLLVEQNERLRELDRMKDDFVASVSHELRTPLTSIRGYLDLVLEGEAGELTDEQRDFLAVVERNSERLLRVVGDLLFVAQVEAGAISLEPGVCDLEELLREAVDAARPAAAEGSLQLDLDTEGLAELVADRARLAQVLDNLISNAIKFTPPGGRVAVRSFRAGECAVIEVGDTGMGISAEDQQRLFERFFRTASAGEQAIQGTGLGLAIVKALVEAHGGTISVSSVVGEGTTFCVSLPLVRAEVAA